MPMSTAKPAPGASWSAWGDEVHTKLNTVNTVATIVANSTLTVHKSGTTWPSRPTSRADVTVQWKGPDPGPPIVTSGTGGMLDEVDIRFVTP